jgi:hypothetical protein
LQLGQLRTSAAVLPKVLQVYAFVSTAMPQGLAGDLSPEICSDIIAYILAANGAKPGPAPFNSNSNIKIGAVANGQIVPAAITPE